MRFRQILRTSLSLSALMSVLVAQNVSAALANNNGTGGKVTVEKVAHLFGTWNRSASNRIFDSAADLIDYHEMSQRALGSSNWDKLKPQEREEFVKTLRRLIEGRYYMRWHKIFSRGGLKFQKESQSGDDQFVTTSLVVGKKEDTLIWRLSGRSGQYKVISLKVNEKDLLDRLSTRLQKRLQKDGFKELLVWMREEADDEAEDSHLHGDS